MTERAGLFRYVRYADLPAFHERGWMIVADLGPTHGFWSCLMWHAEDPNCEWCRNAG